MNSTTRDFVAKYDKLEREFETFKRLVAIEINLLNYIAFYKDGELEAAKLKAKDFEKALRIPREHYKFIDKLKYEEIVTQRDQIIAKVQKAYNVSDKDYALRMLTMPDQNQTM